jgi:hypothetical protein
MCPTWNTPKILWRHGLLRAAYLWRNQFSVYFVMIKNFTPPPFKNILIHPFCPCIHVLQVRIQEFSKGGVQPCQKISSQFFFSRTWKANQTTPPPPKKKNNNNKKHKKQILCHEIESNPLNDRTLHGEETLVFEMNLWNLFFFLTVLLIFVCSCKYKST